MIRKLSLIAFMALMLVLSSATMTTSAATQQATSAVTVPTEMERQVIDLTNQLRRDLGLPLVCAIPELTLSARRHSQDMADRNYHSHTAPDPAPYGSGFVARARAAGYQGSPRGENIGAGYTTAQSIFNAWFNSPGHYDNMTNPNINEIGVGYARTVGSSYGGHRWTMVTGSGNTPCVTRTYTAGNVNVDGNLIDAPAEPTFTWNHNLNTDDPGKVQAEWYRLVVVGNGNVVLDTWVPVDQQSGLAAACSGSSCSYTAEQVDWQAGDYDLWIGAWSQAGGEQWVTEGRTFTVATGPSVPAMTSPSNGATVNTAAFNLEWNQDNRAEWYNIIVVDPDGGVAVDQWRPNDNTVCDNSTCRLYFQPTQRGTHTWWMRAWSSQGFSMGGYQDSGFSRRTFNVNPGRPGVVDGRTPADEGTISAGATTLSWSNDTNASYYSVYLAGPNGVVRNTWYSSGDICSGSTCSVSGLNLTAGEYIWWMVAWGPAGFSTGGFDNSGWTGSAFTVQ